MIYYKIMETSKYFLRYKIIKGQKKCQVCVSFTFTNDHEIPVFPGLSKVVL